MPFYQIKFFSKICTLKRASNKVSHSKIGVEIMRTLNCMTSVVYYIDLFGGEYPIVIEVFV